MRLCWSHRNRKHTYVDIFYSTLDSSFSSTTIFFRRYWLLKGQQAKGGDHFYSSLPLLLAYKHSGIYLQLCTCDDYHVLLIALLVTTSLLDEIHLLTIWLLDDTMLISVYFTWWFDSRLSLQPFQTGRFVLICTITLAFLVDQLTGWM